MIYFLLLERFCKKWLAGGETRCFSACRLRFSQAGRLLAACLAGKDLKVMAESCLPLFRRAVLGYLVEPKTIKLGGGGHVIKLGPGEPAVGFGIEEAD
ncbi:MAG: hypothetical protein CO042_03000, partial [Parcubacteria group bacterium CG_4_9_14_0_2_um_filter_41_8]